jgi:hypothetical protein
MRPRIRIRIVFCLAAATLLTACSSGRQSVKDTFPRNQADICAIFQDNPHWLEAAREAQDHWGTPIATKMAIIWRESNFRGEARPVRYVNGRPAGYLSSAYGFAQAIDGTWDWYRQETGRHDADRTNFADAIDFVGWYMNKTADLNGIPFWDAQNQYFAYHDGHTGFKRGSWRQKAFLLRAAAQVQAQAQRYQSQAPRCI